VTGEDKSPQDWSPDGRLVLYTSQDPKSGSDLWSLSPDGDGKPSVVVQTPFDETQAQFSPDGRWIAYASNETGRYEIYVRSFPGPGGKWQVSTEGGIYPRWRRDGKELFYVAADGSLVSVPITLGPNLQAGTGNPLFRLETGIRTFDVSPDGSRFLVSTPVEKSPESPIRVILNWEAALRKPAG